MKTTQSEEQTDRLKKKTWDLQINIKHANLHITEVPESKEREKKIKNVFVEIMAEDFPNLKKKKRYPGTGNTDRQFQIRWIWIDREQDTT